MKYLHHKFAPVWNVTGFDQDDLQAYSQDQMLHETRRGLMTLCILISCILIAEAWFYFALLNDSTYLYTCLLLAGLGFHLGFSCLSISEIKPLHLMGMCILVVSGTAFVLLAQQSGSFSTLQFISIVMLFMVIPIIPWGLREGLIVAGLIYGTFTFSTWGMYSHFNAENLWTLQFIMLGSGIVSLVLVARNAAIRKADIKSRFELEQAHNRIMVLSNKDPLTGAWNRRFFAEQFEENLQNWNNAGVPYYFACLDIDDFKPLNDTYGHAYGDKVLKYLVYIINFLLGDQGVLIRMGGDEFVLVFRDHDPRHLFKQIFDKLQKRINEKTTERMTIGFSVGVINVDPAIDFKTSDLYRSADVALYQAKDGKGINKLPNVVIRSMGKAKDVENIAMQKGKFAPLAVQK